MNFLSLNRWALPLLCAALLGACVAYPVSYTAVPAPGPSTFDRSWDAALAAAGDSGVRVTSADRATGRITGQKGPAAVTIDIQSLPDGRVQVAFNAPGSTETNPTLADRLSGAYNRRMGR